MKVGTSKDDNEDEDLTQVMPILETPKEDRIEEIKKKNTSC